MKLLEAEGSLMYGIQVWVQLVTQSVQVCN